MELSELSLFLKPLVTPWYDSLAKPAQAQEQTLHNLVQFYTKTEYGVEHGVSEDTTLDQFRSSVPIVTYQGLKPYLERVRQGDHTALLAEPVERWVMTRGTTGTPKIIPTTRTHLAQILFVGARAIVNFALKRGELEMLQGGVLNLNFPSEVARLNTPKGAQSYGYSSGTYAKLNPELGGARLIPKQEEIDALGGGVSKGDWENRFELVYRTAKDADVKSLMGVTPVLTAFAKYVRKRHRVLPRKLWNLKGIFCTSVAKIQTRYAPLLRFYYGDAPVVEMYTATEGVFAQQLDDRPYVCPNYDAYLFEVKTRNGIKMLHEMRPREWGRIVISSPLFPRYDIGDLVEALGKGYFRVLGRARRLTALEHVLYNVLSARLV